MLILFILQIMVQTIFTDHQRAILVLNNDGGTTSEINGNKITLNQTIDNLQLAGQDYRGIKLENCIGINLEDNTVEWTKNPDDGVNYGDIVQGIFLYNTQSTILTQNKISKAGYGIRFMSDCSATYLYCNTMEQCYNGAYLDGSGVTTIVSDQGTWTGSISTSESWKNKWVNNQGAYRVDGNNIGNPPRWLHKTLDGSEYDPNPYNPLVLTFTNPVSFTNGCTAPAMMSAMMRESAFGDVVHDTIIDDPDSSNFKYALQETFFEVFKEKPELLDLNVASDIYYQNTYSELNQSNVGKMHEIKEHVNNYELANANTKLLLLQDENVFESNKKTAIKSYINYYRDTISPDSVNLTDLQIIAFSHPFYGGVAVHWVRGMLHLDIEDALPALRKGRTIPVKNSAIVPFNGKVQPNPASNHVLLVLEEPLKLRSTLNIYNSMSVLVTTLVLEENIDQLEINTSNWNPGIYSLHLFNNENELKLPRLIINQ
jgi:Secretion system C-terminal sorting domain